MLNELIKLIIAWTLMGALLATLLLPIAAIAIWGTLEGNGPFLLSTAQGQGEGVRSGNQTRRSAGRARHSA